MSKPKSIEALITESQVRKSTKVLPYDLIDGDLREIIKAELKGSRIPSTSQLQIFFLDKHGIRFGRTSLAARLNQLRKGQA